MCSSNIHQSRKQIREGFFPEHSIFQEGNWTETTSLHSNYGSEMSEGYKKLILFSERKNQTVGRGNLTTESSV